MPRARRVSRAVLAVNRAEGFSTRACRHIVYVYAEREGELGSRDGDGSLGRTDLRLIDSSSRRVLELATLCPYVDVQPL
jgi:hypothetical protein